LGAWSKWTRCKACVPDKKGRRRMIGFQFRYRRVAQRNECGGRRCPRIDRKDTRRACACSRRRNGKV
jgi:hypothetical protein